MVVLADRHPSESYSVRSMSLDVSEQQGPPSAAARQIPLAAMVEGFAWRYRRYIGLFVAAIYLLSFNGLWRVGRDSALYLSIARNVARGEGYVYQGEVHRLAYPGLTYLLAGIIKVGGDHAILIADAIILAASLLTLYLFYRLFALIARPGAAIVATVFFGVNNTFYDLSFAILTDIPFLLGTAMVLLGGGTHQHTAGAAH